MNLSFLGARVSEHMKFIRFIILFAVIVLLFTTKTFSQTLPIDNISPTPLASGEIEYPLPYHGILPGRPLYLMKMLRDGLLEILTLNPYKKTEFYLHQADKHLSSAITLFDNGEKDKARKCFSKGQDYLERSILEEENAKISHGNLMELSEKIKTSSRKQKEIARRFYVESSGKQKIEFSKELERSENMEKLAEAFRL